VNKLARVHNHILGWMIFIHYHNCLCPLWSTYTASGFDLSASCAYMAYL